MPPRRGALPLLELSIVAVCRHIHRSALPLLWDLLMSFGNLKFLLKHRIESLSDLPEHLVADLLER